MRTTAHSICPYEFERGCHGGLFRILSSSGISYIGDPITGTAQVVWTPPKLQVGLLDGGSTVRADVTGTQTDTLTVTTTGDGGPYLFSLTGTGLPMTTCP